MSKTLDLRPFPLFLPGPLDRPAAQAWLDGQPEAIRRVTYIDESGSLMQKPVIDAGAFVDPSALLIGGMIVSPGCYIGPKAVIRLDENDVPEPLIIGRESNVQDFALIHSHTTSIGKRVIVAHQAVVHGATVEDEAALYIQAVADGGTTIGRGSFLDQGSYVGKSIRLAPRRYVAPGVKVLTQGQADELPPVPDTIERIRLHVLELNALHVERHLACAPDGG